MFGERGPSFPQSSSRETTFGSVRSVYPVWRQLLYRTSAVLAGGGLPLLTGIYGDESFIKSLTSPTTQSKDEPQASQ